MQTTRLICAVFLWIGSILFLGKLGICQTLAYKSTAAGIELTDSDLFSTRGWSSQQVRVMGFSLGMTWPEVQEHVRARHLDLIGEGVPGKEAACAGQGWCQVCEAQFQCGGLALDFGTSREIIEMSISKVPEDAAKKARHNAIQRRFKGTTRDFFEQYSKDLRLKVLGPESSHESVGALGIEYRYRELGLVIEISPCPSHPVESPCSELELKFVPPSPVPQVSR
jgi:hypothetical protein